MIDFRDPTGRQSWPAPSAMEVLFRIESRLGGLEKGQDLTLLTVREEARKVDHAHARITDLRGRVDRLEQAAKSPSLAATGQPPTERQAGLLVALTDLLTALAAAAPSLGTILILLAWLTAALTVGINAETVKALIGLSQ